MDKKEKKRLEDLQKDGHKEIGGYLLEKLTYPDLQLLLLADTTIQELIRQIVAPLFSTYETEAAANVQSADQRADSEVLAKSKTGKNRAALSVIDTRANVEPSTPVIVYRDREVMKEVIKEVVKKVPYEVRVEVPANDPLRTELATELALLKAVQADAELAEAWLWGTESEGRQLVRLLAMLSEWDEVLSLWSRLADRCKSGQRAASPSERTILQVALDLHNLRWRNRAAKLVMAEVGASFHHETMERGSVKGNTVAELWLPGLDNAAGQSQKKPVVKTT